MNLVIAELLGMAICSVVAIAIIAIAIYFQERKK